MRIDVHPVEAGNRPLEELVRVMGVLAYLPDLQVDLPEEFRVSSGEPCEDAVRRRLDVERVRRTGLRSR